MVIAKKDGVFQRKDCAGWYVSFVDSAGRRRKRRVEAHTRTQALTALHALKTKVQAEQILGVKHASEMTTKQFLSRFQKHQKARLKLTTYERLGGILRTLEAALPIQLKAVDREAVAAFVSARSDAVAPGTVQKEVSTLKHALRLAVEWDLIQSNPAAKVRLPRAPEGRTRYLSPTELKSVLEAASPWMRPPLALAAFTGMRRGEILGLRWKDVDLEGRRVYLHDTKNGALRVVPLNDMALKVMQSLKDGGPSDLILPGVDATRLSVYTKRLFSALKIQQASFHSLRHTAASWLVMGGADLYAVGQILGHKTPRMTQRYAHLSPQYMAATASKLDLAFAGVLSLPSGA